MGINLNNAKYQDYNELHNPHNKRLNRKKAHSRVVTNDVFLNSIITDYHPYGILQCSRTNVFTSHI